MIVILMMGLLEAWDSPLQPSKLPIPLETKTKADSDDRDGDDRIPVSNKREDIRKARIESEQVSQPHTKPYHPHPKLKPLSPPSVPRLQPRLLPARVVTATNTG